MLNQKQFQEINLLISEIQPLAEAWKGEILFSIDTELTLVERDNSHDGMDAFRPGGIAQMTQSNLILKIRDYQAEEYSLFFNMPDCNLSIPLPCSNLNFYRKALIAALTENAPTEADWIQKIEEKQKQIAEEQDLPY